MSAGLLTPAVAATPRRIQRACACGARAAQGGKCDACKRLPLQRRADASASNAQAVAPRGAADAVLAGRGSALDGGTRALLEQRFGHDFSSVRVHADGAAAASAHALGAAAYATGNHVVFGAGRYAPRSRAGLWLLAHELAHTVQQRLGGAALQTSRAVAPAHDPSEAAADRAADAVVAGAPVPQLAAAGAGLHCYSITRVEPVDADQALVHLDTGTRYRVHRGHEFVVRESMHNWADLKPGADRQRVWLELEWCAGKNHGSLRVSADVPAQVAKAVVAAVTKGSDPRQILRDARITPRADLKLLQSGDFSLSANGEVTLDINGKPTGFGGGATLSKGAFDFNVKVEPGKGADDKPQGVQATGGITWTPGRRDKKEDCRREQRSVVEIANFSCETERDVPPKDVLVDVTVIDHASRTVYFDYAKSSVDRGRSSADLQALQRDLADGYSVEQIAGYTSPEGPMGPGNGGFIGNTALAQARAEAAAKEVLARCPAPAQTDGAAPADAQRACFVGGAGVAGSANPELYTRVVVDDDGVVTEIEGTPLADAAVGDFMAAPAEADRRTPELAAGVGSARSAAGRVALVYPLLRRAVVYLTRDRVETQLRQKAGSTDVVSASCPQDVIDAAFSGSKAKP